MTTTTDRGRIEVYRGGDGWRCRDRLADGTTAEWDHKGLPLGDAIGYALHATVDPADGPDDVYLLVTDIVTVPEGDHDLVDHEVTIEVQVA